MQTDITDARVAASKAGARVAWLEEQLGPTAYSAEHVDDDARLRAEAEMAEGRLELPRIGASLEAGGSTAARIRCWPNQQRAHSADREMTMTNDKTTPSEMVGTTTASCGTSEEDDGCQANYLGQVDVHDWVEEHVGSPAAAALGFAVLNAANSGHAVALPIEESLRKLFFNRVNAGELLTGDEGCWREGVGFGMRTMFQTVLDMVEDLSLSAGSERREAPLMTHLSPNEILAMIEEEESTAARPVIPRTSASREGKLEMESEIDPAQAELKQASKDRWAGRQAGIRWAEEEDTGMNDVKVYLSCFKEGVLVHWGDLYADAGLTDTSTGHCPPQEEIIEKLIAAGFRAAARRAIRHAPLSDKQRQQMLEQIARPTLRFGTVVSLSETAAWFGQIEDLTDALDCCTCLSGFEDAADQVSGVIAQLREDLDDDDDEDPVIGHLEAVEWCLDGWDRGSAKKIIDHLWRVGSGREPLLKLIWE